MDIVRAAPGILKPNSTPTKERRRRHRWRTPAANRAAYLRGRGKQFRQRKYEALALQADNLIKLATRQGWPGERGPAELTAAFLALERAVLALV